MCVCVFSSTAAFQLSIFFKITISLLLFFHEDYLGSTVHILEEAKLWLLSEKC